MTSSPLGQGGHRRRRPILFVLRQAGSPFIWLGNLIEGDFRYECDGTDFDGVRQRCRRVPLSWSSEAGENARG